jgi:hypothetical protein
MSLALRLLLEIRTNTYYAALVTTDAALPEVRVNGGRPAAVAKLCVSLSGTRRDPPGFVAVTVVRA